eukprot:CAMPEP_0117426202 /NCGR_PEP_ID=MMETSP0758-20121206/6355_1 /TAXON_ID=63605 /ORGANISM="Percolomonas cosmopolitus, Strain AE-1 (ATCC 50343)" /LENGTH=258 /DNA_ID=CAMNT_0005211213 /DNA_START=1089 /DNA_END=1862 /DNA_ORIENTATION=-
METQFKTDISETFAINHELPINYDAHPNLPYICRLTIAHENGTTLYEHVDSKRWKEDVQPIGKFIASFVQLDRSIDGGGLKRIVLSSSTLEYKEEFTQQKETTNKLQRSTSTTYRFYNQKKPQKHQTSESFSIGFDPNHKTLSSSLNDYEIHELSPNKVEQTNVQMSPDLYENIVFYPITNDQYFIVAAINESPLKGRKRLHTLRSFLKAVLILFLKSYQDELDLIDFQSKEELNDAEVSMPFNDFSETFELWLDTLE